MFKKFIHFAKQTLIQAKTLICLLAAGDNTAAT